jgi:DNA-binding NarL/FixJ family response regulator
MKKMLIADSLYPVVDSIMHFLDRSDVAPHTGGRHDDLLRLHFNQRASLIVTQPDLPGMSCESFVNVIRRNEALRNVSILLFISDEPDQRERAARCGANCIIPRSAPAEEINRRVHGLLNIAPRSSYRVVMHMAVESSKHNKPFMCTMENISANGMMVRTTETLSPGNRIRCAFTLPDGKRIATDGAVMRVVAGEADSRRYGIHFLSMAKSDTAAIASFVEKEWRLRREGGAGGRSRIA